MANVSAPKAAPLLRRTTVRLDRAARAASLIVFFTTQSLRREPFFRLRLADPPKRGELPGGQIARPADPQVAE